MNAKYLLTRYKGWAVPVKLGVLFGAVLFFRMTASGRLQSQKGRITARADATQFSALFVIGLEIRERATSPLSKA